MAETVAIKVAIDTSKSAKNLGQLEKSAEDLNDLLKKADFGTKEFEELNQALKDVNRQIKTQSFQWKHLTTNKWQVK